MDFLRDPLWQFIGAVIAIIGVVAAVWIYRRQRNKKSLSYEILASNELLTASEEIRGKIKILFGKKRVQNVHLLVVQFTNDGNVHMLPSDFYQPIRISFGEKATILSAEIIEHFPEKFNPEITQLGNEIEIVPTLINSHDSFTIKFLLAEYRKSALDIGGRIVGVNAITEDTGKATRRRLIIALLAAFLLVSILGLIAVLVFANTPPGEDRFLLFMTVFAAVVGTLGALFQSWDLYHTWRSRKKKRGL